MAPLYPAGEQRKVTGKETLGHKSRPSLIEKSIENSSRQDPERSPVSDQRPKGSSRSTAELEPGLSPVLGRTPYLG